jgi:hypothetical protein
MEQVRAAALLSRRPSIAVGLMRLRWLPDGQFAQMRHAQIACRAILP